MPLLSYNHHKNELLGTLPACIYVTQKLLGDSHLWNYLHLRVLLQAYRCTSLKAKIYTDMHCMLINQFKAILFETLAHQRGIMMNM